MQRPPERTPLVMVHGLLGPLDYFAPQTLLPGLVVHCPDLPGYGDAPPVSDPDATLADLAHHVAEHVRREVRTPAWILGHSLGGAVAMLLAHDAPELVAGVVNVEGNFTLKDAFWTSHIAARSVDAWSAEYEAMRADPEAWLRGVHVEATPERVRRAAHILGYQPAAAVHVASRALVRGTRDPEYLVKVRRVVERVPLVLVAGERSEAAWDVPAWVREAAVASRVQPGAGHMMMLEDPEAFCGIVGDVVPGDPVQVEDRGGGGSEPRRFLVSGRGQVPARHRPPASG